MSLHQTVEFAKKAGLISGATLAGLIVLFIVIRVGIVIKNIMYPPKTVPPNQAYGQLPPIQFPTSEYTTPFSYKINTLTGELPEFPARVNVYPIKQYEPNFLNLDKAKAKAISLRFIRDTGSILPERRIGEVMYEWSETTGQLRRVLKFNILTFDFTMTSNYLSSLTVLNAQHISDQANAISTARDFLTTVNLLPSDIDFDKTQNPNKEMHFITGPQLFSIQNSALIPTTSLSKTRVFRVNLYQKDISYDLDTGVPGAAKVPLTLPMLYPKPPYSTMSFWVASGPSAPEVVATNYYHKDIIFPAEGEPVATYPIKTTKEAFEELQNGMGYVAAYDGTDSEILINNVTLGYYLGEGAQEYLTPVIAFEGDKGFFAYVSAIKEGETPTAEETPAQ